MLTLLTQIADRKEIAAARKQCAPFDQWIWDGSKTSSWTVFNLCGDSDASDAKIANRKEIAAARNNSKQPLEDFGFSAFTAPQEPMLVIARPDFSLQFRSPRTAQCPIHSL